MPGSLPSKAFSAWQDTRSVYTDHTIASDNRKDRGCSPLVGRRGGLAAQMDSVGPVACRLPLPAACSPLTLAVRGGSVAERQPTPFWGPSKQLLRPPTLDCGRRRRVAYRDEAAFPWSKSAPLRIGAQRRYLLLLAYYCGLYCYTHLCGASDHHSAAHARRSARPNLCQPRRRPALGESRSSVALPEQMVYN